MNNFLLKIPAFLVLTLLSCSTFAQKSKIKELDFLIGTWEVFEENQDKSWWEKSTRKAEYILEDTYIKLTTDAISSSGKKRQYQWFIHHNDKTNQFEMVSIFSNWHKVQFDVLSWEDAKRKIVINSTNHPNSTEYHERYGEIIFNDKFTEYTWSGKNKYGNPNSPSVWIYTEKGMKRAD